MRTLIAVTYVLYQSHQYKPGDELPASDEDMVNAWIDAGSAAWVEEPVDKPKKSKAKSVTAQAGSTGTAIPASKEDLTGVIPDTPERSK